MKRNQIAFCSVILCLIATLIFSLMVGSVSVSLKDIISAIFYGGGGSAGIIRDIRIPRIFMAVMVGANLSVSGALLQGVMRNPLADPGITGISSGASVVVMILMLYVPSATKSIPLFGFLGGMLACMMVYSLAWRNGITAVRIILAGVAVNAMLGGLTSMISIMNSESLSGVLTWLNGDLGKKSWSQVQLMAVYTVIGLIASMFLTKCCNLLALGDKNTKSLGFNPNYLRLLISAIAVFLAGISTAYVGVIGFLGLSVPHISRMLVGSDYKILLPFSALFGSFVLLLADTIGRVVTAPYEIPVGIIMTVIGGPFFLYLLRKDRNSYGH